MPLDDLINGADLAEMVIGGWRYVFSRNFRLKKHREWREYGGRLQMLFEVAFGIAGIVLCSGLFFLLAMWCWSKVAS
jgi:hypothetical protein